MTWLSQFQHHTEIQNVQNGRRYIFNDLPRAIQGLSKLSIPTMLLWGDEDRLYPPTTVDSVDIYCRTLPMNGFRRATFHPAERPWEIADRLTNWTPKRG